MISDCAFVRLNTGVRLAYVEQGARDGAAIVLLHGYSDSHRSFDLIRPHLPRAWRTIAVTQRGHGRSDKPEAGYAMRDFAADVPALLDALKLERAILIGHSMGAAVAMEAAARFPERVAGLALIGAFADFRGNADVAELAGSVSRFSDPIDGEFILAFQESTIFGMIPQRFLDTVIGESLRCPAKVWRGAAEGMLASAPLNAAKQCAAPALLVRGAEDVFVPHADQLKLAGAFPAARVRSMPSVGHAPHWEAPEETAAMLAAFVAELDEPNSL